MSGLDYSIAYSQVLEILKYIPSADYNKIPKEKIDLFKEFANKDYNFNYNPDKTLDEQNVSKITKRIIAILFRDYWATPEQKEKILKLQNEKREEVEQKKREKYNINIFEKADNELNKPVVAMNVVKKEKWYKRLLKKIKAIFTIK